MDPSIDPERDAMIRQTLEANRLAAFLAYAPEEIVLVSGVSPHLGMSLVLYPGQGQPIFYAPTFEPEDTIPGGFRQQRYSLLPGAGLAAWDGLRQWIQQDLEHLGIREVLIGYFSEGGRHALPGNAAETPLLSTSVVSYLLEGTFSQETNALLPAFLYKTAGEVQRIRRANEIAGLGLLAFYAGLQAGRSEAELAAEVEAVIQAQSGRHGCKLARGWAFVQSGPNSALAGTFSRSSGRVLTGGDLVVIELATCVDGYWSDLTRTGCVGQPSEHQQALLRAVKAAQQAAIQAISPGVSHEEVDRAARNVLEKQGYGPGFTHATGHHVGFRYHDYGPMLQPGSTELLETGMVITVEPGVYGAAFGGGARFEDNIYIGPEGADVLSPMDITI